MKLPEVNIGAHRAGLDAFEQVLSLGFDDDLVSNVIQRLVFGCANPAVSGRPMFSSKQRVECILPGARRDSGVAPGQIRLGELKIEVGISEGLVFGQDNLSGRVPVSGLKAGPFACFGVNTVEDASPNAARGQTISCFH